MHHPLEFLCSLHGGLFRRINGEINELFPDVKDCLIGGMNHVLLIKTIVAKIVEKDLVSREIMGVPELLAELVHRQKQRGFAQLVAVESIFQMPQGRNREDELLVGMRPKEIGQDGHGGRHREAQAVEQLRRQLMAIGHHLGGLAIAIHPSSAKTKDDPLALREVFMSFLQGLVDIAQKGFFGGIPELGVMAKGAVELLARSDDLALRKREAVMHASQGIGNADGIVKHPKWIHHGVEAQPPADGPHLIGEAGTQKEDAIAVGDGLG